MLGNLENILDRLDEIFFRQSSHGHLRFSILGDKKNRRDAADVEHRGKFLLLLRVDLVDVDFSFVLLCQILQDRCDDLTGIAPVRIKIDDAGLLSGKTPLLI